MALVSTIAKLDEQFPRDSSPKVLALHEDGLNGYIAEIKGLIDDRTDDDANLEEAVNFYKTEQLQKAHVSLAGSYRGRLTYSITATRCFAVLLLLVRSSRTSHSTSYRSL